MRILAGLLLAALLVSGCGKKGPLVYPDMLVPAAPVDVTAQQSGNSVRISLVLPTKDLAGRDFKGVSGVRIIRRDDPAGKGAVCSSCTIDYVLFRKVDLDPLPADILRYGNQLVLLDGDVQTGRSYAYRVSVLAADGAEGAVSAPVATAMTKAPLPPVLQAISHPTEIHLEFTAIPPHDGVIAGYNVYRAVKGEPLPLLPLNREPLAGNRFVDMGLERTTTYIYAVRSVVRLTAGGIAESLASNEAEARLRDDE